MDFKVEKTHENEREKILFQFITNLNAVEQAI
jgi:hypothetical protein